MKGTPQFPQCGYSANTANILRACGVTNLFSVNLLVEHEIREGIKEYASWPTIPLVFINGQFIGGADITRDLYQSGELQKMLAAIPADQPTA
jgi:monothiol glutaredoxin